MQMLCRLIVVAFSDGSTRCNQNSKLEAENCGAEKKTKKIVQRLCFLLIVLPFGGVLACESGDAAGLRLSRGVLALVFL